jgi:hypothetical protein
VKNLDPDPICSRGHGKWAIGSVTPVFIAAVDGDRTRFRDVYLSGMPGYFIKS